MTKEEARAIVNKHNGSLVAKWDKTVLLDGLKDDINPSKMAVLIESESKIVIVKDTPEQRELNEAMTTLRK